MCLSKEIKVFKDEIQKQKYEIYVLKTIAISSLTRYAYFLLYRLNRIALLSTTDFISQTRGLRMIILSIKMLIYT